MPTKTKEAVPGTTAGSYDGGDIKNVVIIGNGPSAITLSYLLAGNVPYYRGGAGDVYLHKRLISNQEETLVLQNLEDLSQGCEGRSNNPVSVFFDLLNHPDADSGVEKESLLEWRRRPELSVDHVILGKGRPGGCWESLEGNVQTVSLGNWMELPNLKMSQVNCSGEEGSSATRVKVTNVAQYYQEYVRKMELEKFFVSYSEVTSVREVTELSCSASSRRQQQQQQRDSQSVPDLTCPSSGTEDNAIFNQESLYEDINMGDDVFPCFSSEESTTSSSSAATNAATSSGSYSSTSSQGGLMFRGGPSGGSVSDSQGPVSTPQGLSIQDRRRQCSDSAGGRCFYFGECSERDGDLEEMAMSNCCSWNPIVNPELFCSVGTCNGYGSMPRSRAHTWSAGPPAQDVSGSQQKCSVSTCFPNTNRLFEVTGFTLMTPKAAPDDAVATSRSFKYLTKRVVLATGSYDFPNRLSIPGETLPFVLHSLVELEEVILRGDLRTSSRSDPIMVVGAGLSAADAIVTLRHEGISVAHAFRRSVDDPSLIFKMLPKALYPEYHDVFRLMKGELKSEGYIPMAEHHIHQILPNKKVVLHMGNVKKVVIVSYLVILIGSSPDLDFLEPKLRSNLGIIKNEPIGRNNPIDIDLCTNEAVDEPGIYAMGPLVGDNFVRFLQGGALAIASDVLKKENIPGGEP